MEFFNGIGKKISQTGQGVVQKTKDTAEIIKLNGVISDEEKKLNNAYIQIGQLYAVKYQENAEEDFKALVEQVHTSLSEIENLKQQILDIKGVKRCNNCGAEIPVNATFCSGCGAKVFQINMSNFNRCANCGNPVEKGLKFCTSCGLPLEVNSPKTATKICPSCNANINEDVAFCPECGTKLDK